MKITGYGRGWQEPRATTRFGRFQQRLRQPATKIDYVCIALAAFVFQVTLILGAGP